MQGKLYRSYQIHNLIIKVLSGDISWKNIHVPETQNYQEKCQVLIQHEFLYTISFRHSTFMGSKL